jgi:hypothetical protein
MFITVLICCFEFLEKFTNWFESFWNQIEIVMKEIENRKRRKEEKDMKRPRGKQSGPT